MAAHAEHPVPTYPGGLRACATDGSARCQLFGRHSPWGLRERSQQVATLPAELFRSEIARRHTGGPRLSRPYPRRSRRGASPARASARAPTLALAHEDSDVGRGARPARPPGPTHQVRLPDVPRRGGGPPGTSAPTRGSGHVPATSTAAGLSPDVGIRLLQDVLDILQVSRQGRDVQLQFELSLRQQHDKCHVSVRHLLIISAQFKNIALCGKSTSERRGHGRLSTGIRRAGQTGSGQTPPRCRSGRRHSRSPRRRVHRN